MVLRMNAKANNFIRKWLGLPQCLPNTALFNRNLFTLPLKSTSLGFKQEKLRLVFQLKGSADPTVRNTRAQVQTGHKWDAGQAVEQVISRLRHREIVGVLQPSRTDFNWGPASKIWSKANKKERQDLLIS